MIPIVREHIILTPRGERLPCVQSHYTHPVWVKDDSDSPHDPPPVRIEFCTVRLGELVCEHGWQLVSK